MTTSPVAAVSGSHYRYGSSFVDPTSGLRWEAHHPATRPDRWQEYLDGAVREYERYGLAELIDREALHRADGVSVFFVGLGGDGRIAAGFRCHGPLDDVAASRALSEMATSPEAPRLIEFVREAVPHGVIEIKGAWRSASGNGTHVVADAIVRCIIHALQWLGAEVALAAVREGLQPLATLTGARRVGTEGSAFPSEEYRTILMAWYRSDFGPRVRPDQATLIRAESEQLRAGPPAGTEVGWRPVVLDARRRSDRQILANLRADPAVDVVEVAARQRRELRQILPAPGPELLDEPTRHVYYPWRRVVVHMLGPRAFPVVRLDRNRNRITGAEQDRLRARRVGVVGLSAGHAVATTLALGGLCGELRLADFDHVELTNMNRLPAAVFEIGINKAVLCARRVAEVDPYLPVHVYPGGLDGGSVEAFVAGVDVLVEECDAIDMKLLVREVARRHRIPVLMETSDRGLLDVERFDREPDRPILHGLVPGVTAASLAALPVAEKLPYVLDIVDAGQTSARGAASLAEIGRTLSTWPQLAGDVVLGGATAAAAVRRLGLGEPLPSGRVRIDVDAMLDTLSSPPDPRRREWPPPPPDPVPPDADEPVTVMAHAASLAPSGGNAQPWRFVAGAGHLSIELDRRRTSTMDVQWRGSYVAIGAALFNARTAAAARSRLGPVSLFSEGPRSDVVATVTLGDGSDAELAALYPGVLDRRTNRRRGTRQPLDLDLAARLAAAAEAEGARLHLVTGDDDLAALAEELGRSERVRFLTERLHQEMIGELRWPGDDLATGIDVRTLELEAAEAAALEVARRPDVMRLLEQWDAGQALGDNARRAVHASSAVAVVTVPEASPACYVRGGAAVERVWVTAQAAGLSVQPVSPVHVFAVDDADFAMLGGERWAAELQAQSARFRELVDLAPTEAVALVLRLDHAPPPLVRSQRLPLDQVLAVREPAGSTS